MEGALSRLHIYPQGYSTCNSFKYKGSIAISFPVVNYGENIIITHIFY